MKTSCRAAVGAGLGVLMVLIAGCVDVDARLPERVNIGGAEYGSEEPVQPVPPADSSDPAALARENLQLRQQNAALARQLGAARAALKDARERLDDKDEQVDRLAEKIDDLEEKIEDLQDELDKARQRR